MYFVLGGIHAPHISVAVKSHNDFPKLRFFMQCSVPLLCLYSCPIQHVLAVWSHISGEIRRLEHVFTAYTLGANSKTTQLISLQTHYLYPIPVLSHVYIYVSLYKSE